MSVTDFEQRRNKVLELVIEAYIASAEPVGSEFISRKFRPSLSPATIRNIMVELEEAGFLIQPHTSAGRVPTDLGYRFYVDMVMDARHLQVEEMRRLEVLVQPEEMDVDHLLARASSVLSDLTKQVAFAIAPTVKRSRVRQIELVPLSVRKLLCVMVANEEMIASHVVEVEEPMSREEATALARFINTELAGISFSHLLDSLERRMLAESDSFYHFVKRSLEILQHALSTEPNERFFLEGASYVITQPEFSKDPQKAHELLRGLDAEELLLSHIRQDISAEGVRVRIGGEIRVPGLETCSYLTAPVFIGSEVIGGVGVLGPKRMDYPRVRSFVEGMGRCLSEFLGRWEITG